MNDSPFLFGCIALCEDGSVECSRFAIRMKRNSRLNDLAVEIPKHLRLDPAIYPPAELWRPKSSIPFDDPRLSERVRSLKPFEPDGETQLLNILLTVDGFCTTYHPDKLDLHVIAKLQPVPIVCGKKRSRTQYEESTPPFLLGPMITLSPSSAARPDEVRSMQQYSDQRVANNRPNVDFGHTPIALLYRGFGCFLDHIACGSADTVDVADGVNIHALEEPVGAFVDAMRDYYPDEETRRDAAVTLLNDIFNCHPSSDKFADSSRTGLQGTFF
ncbi:hypothetical protein BC834DRAFT_313901 [Gloeopeniophorella convolvens]|nr:hypothetical protein BC834DRAFT_313901 [Gloeopeniophorella convolvens]